MFYQASLNSEIIFGYGLHFAASESIKFNFYATKGCPNNCTMYFINAKEIVSNFLYVHC